MLISGLSKFGNASKDFSSLGYDCSNHKYTSFQGFNLVYGPFFIHFEGEVQTYGSFEQAV